MNRIYLIRDKNNRPIKTYRKTWAYKTLGTAKMAAKNYIRNKNKSLSKNKRISFNDIKVIECDVIEKDTHPI